MENEDDLRRPPANQAYKPGEISLKIPDKAVTATIAFLKRAGRRESGLFWYGPKDTTGNGLVTYVVAPRQEMSWGNYHVSAQAIAEIVHRLPEGWKPLAQIHSHPGKLVEHSNYDDRMIMSKKILSLVFPTYGNINGVFPSGIGVHEWQNDYWHFLSDRDARSRVTLCKGNVKSEDLR